MKKHKKRAGKLLISIEKVRDLQQVYGGLCGVTCDATCGDTTPPPPDPSCGATGGGGCGVTAANCSQLVTRAR